MCMVKGHLVHIRTQEYHEKGVSAHCPPTTYFCFSLQLSIAILSHTYMYFCFSLKLSIGISSQRIW